MAGTILGDLFDNGLSVFKEFASYDLQKTQFENAQDVQNQIDKATAENAPVTGNFVTDNKTALIIGGVVIGAIALIAVVR